MTPKKSALSRKAATTNEPRRNPSGPARDRVRARHVQQVQLQAAVLNDPDALIVRPTVAALTSVGATRMYELIAAGLFPRQIKFGSKSVWRVGDIRAWLAAQANQVSK